MAAIASLLYFLLIAFNLHKIAVFQPHGQLRFRQRQDDPRGFLELVFLIVADVRHPALSETVHEECPGSAPEKDEGPVAFGLAFSRPRDPLFNDPTAKVSVNLASFGEGNCPAQVRICNTFLPGETFEPPGFEDPHICALRFIL